MLLARPFFKTFTQRDVCDASRLAFSCERRAAVGEMVKTG